MRNISTSPDVYPGEEPCIYSPFFGTDWEQTCRVQDANTHPLVLILGLRLGFGSNQLVRTQWPRRHIT